MIDYYRFSEDYRLLFGGPETISSKFVKDAKKFVAKKCNIVSETRLGRLEVFREWLMRLSLRLAHGFYTDFQCLY